MCLCVAVGLLSNVTRRILSSDFNCIAGQQVMLDNAGQPGQRTQGYWTGLRHVTTDFQLYDVWRDLKADGRAFTHIASRGQSAGRLDRWLISEQLRARLADDRTGHRLPRDHLGVSLCLTAPRSTCYGAAAWRTHLQLIDDQPFCDRLTDDNPAYLTVYPSDWSSLEAADGGISNATSRTSLSTGHGP